MLTPENVIRQSELIHPEWTPKDHLDYLINDEFVAPSEACKAVARHFGVTVTVVGDSMSSADFEVVPR